MSNEDLVVRRGESAEIGRGFASLPCALVPPPLSFLHRGWHKEGQRPAADQCEKFCMERIVQQHLSLCGLYRLAVHT